MAENNAATGSILTQQDWYQEIPVSPDVKFLKGDKGDKGDVGPQGPQGPKGDRGERGATGEAGPKGEQGPQGAQGPKGDAGPKGDRGERGYQGAQGPQGATGPKGDRGEQGPRGEQGIQGPAGPTGPAGPAGERGEKGETGAQGSRGVSIESVVQSVIATEDDAYNTIRVYFSTGDHTSFVVKNGSKGSKGDKGDPGSGASSWNDLTDKPFGEEVGMVEVLAECQPPYDEGEAAFILTENVPALVAGETYVVSWNGAEYTCVAQDLSEMMEGAVAFGGENLPFEIMFLDGMGYIFALDGAIELTIAIYQNGTVIKPLDPKFLPEGLPWVEKGGRVEVLAETTLTWGEDGFFIESAPSLVAGKTYTVTYNGADYECVGQDLSELMEIAGAVGLGELSAFGLSGNGEPFIVVFMGGAITFETVDGSTSDITVAIYGKGEVVHTLDPKFLPDGVPYVVDDGERVEVLAECQPGYAIENDAFLVTNAPELVVGETYKVSINGVVYVAQAIESTAIGQEGYVFLGDAYTATGGVIGSAPTGEPFAILAQAGSGAFVVKSFEGLTSMTLAIYQGGGIVRKMDARCLPDEAATKSYVEELLGVVADGSY